MNEESSDFMWNKKERNYIKLNVLREDHRKIDQIHLIYSILLEVKPEKHRNCAEYCIAFGMPNNEMQFNKNK